MKAWGFTGLGGGLSVRGDSGGKRLGGGDSRRRGRGVRLVVLGFVGARDHTGVISVARKGRFWYCSASKETRKMEPGSRARSLSPQRAA